MLFAQVRTGYTPHDHRVALVGRVGVVVFAVILFPIGVGRAGGAALRQALGQLVQPLFGVGGQGLGVAGHVVNAVDLLQVVVGRPMEKRAGCAAVLQVRQGAAAPQRVALRVAQRHLPRFVLCAPYHLALFVHPGQVAVGGQERHQRCVGQGVGYPAVTVGQGLEQAQRCGHPAAAGVQQPPGAGGGLWPQGGAGQPCHSAFGFGAEVAGVAQRGALQQLAVGIQKAGAVIAVCHQPTGHVAAEMAPAFDHHLAPGVQVAVAVVPAVRLVVVGQPFAVEGLDAWVAGLEHPLPFRIDQSPGLSVHRGCGHRMVVKGTGLRKAGRNHPLPLVVHIAAQALVAARVPLLGQCQAHGSKVVQLVKAGFAREAALAVDDAPALRPHFHSGQAVAQGAGVFKLRRDHLLRQQVDVAPAPVAAKAGQAIVRKAARVVECGRNQPLALRIDVAPAAIQGLRRADETALPVVLKLHHLAQRRGGHDGLVGVHDEQRVCLPVRPQRYLGQPWRCRCSECHWVVFLRAAS